MKQTMKWIKENRITAALMLVILFAVIFSSIRSASAYDNCIAGAWHDPTVPTEGIDIQVVDGRLVTKFYTYSESELHQRWYVMVFEPDSDGMATVFTTKDKLNRNSEDVGRATFDFLSPDEILIVININLDLDKNSGGTPWCIGCERVLQYDRLTRSINCE